MASAPPTAAAPLYGVYDSGGNLFLQPDSIIEMRFAKDYRVPNYPIEGGQFQSYNKVEMPEEINLVMTIGGSQSARSAFLTKMKSALGDLNNYSVRTPDMTYRNVNFTHLDYDRSAAAGASLLSLNVTLDQVRVGAAAAMTNVTPVGATANVSGGTAQPATPTANQTPAGTVK